MNAALLSLIFCSKKVMLWRKMKKKNASLAICSEIPKWKSNKLPTQLLLVIN
jgi:hypothetical protein